MADPEKERDLESLENARKTAATVTYENVPGSGETAHQAYWRKLADPWLSRRFENRIDFAWYTPPFVGLDQKVVFPVKDEAIDGSGSAKLEWTVWAKPDQLNTLQMELYAVMRAEEHYITAGYTKISSKYFSPTSGQKPIPSENFGIDSFFRKPGDMYVACESKFTKDVDTFNDWKSRGSRDDVKAFLRQRLSKKDGLRQMTWPWIKSRIARSMERPPVELPKRSEAQKDRVRAEVEEMHTASTRKKIKRSVNVYGAKSVPIYPGRYKFRCAERGVVSKHVLHLKWDLKVKSKEFLDLDEDFDDWIDE